MLPLSQVKKKRNGIKISDDFPLSRNNSLIKTNQCSAGNPNPANLINVYNWFHLNVSASSTLQWNQHAELDHARENKDFEKKNQQSKPPFVIISIFFFFAQKYYVAINYAVVDPFMLNAVFSYRFSYTKMRKWLFDRGCRHYMVLDSKACRIDYFPVFNNSTIASYSSILYWISGNFVICISFVWILFVVVVGGGGGFVVVVGGGFVVVVVVVGFVAVAVVVGGCVWWWWWLF